jgi:hypothetical protein
MQRNFTMRSILLQQDRNARPRGTAYFISRVWLAIALGLLATGLFAAWTGQVQAATEAELTELIRCSNRCRNDEGACSAGCCGRIFCKKGCLSDCANTRIGCEEGCYDQLGGTSDSAFFETVTLGVKARAIRASGPLQCPEGAEAAISVTLTQSSGAIAQGETQVACPAGEGTFTVRAVVIGRPRFRAPSTVTACGLAQIHIGARDIQALQWCRDVTLLPGGLEIEE